MLYTRPNESVYYVRYAKALICLSPLKNDYIIIKNLESNFTQQTIFNLIYFQKKNAVS